MSNTTKADLLMVLVTLLAAVGWMFSKEAVSQMPPLMFMGIRFLLAGMLLAFLGSRLLRQMTRAQYLRSIRVGLAFSVAMCFWVLGLHRAEHVGEGAFLTSLSVVVVPLLARMLFQEAQPATTWLALPVAIAGLALLSLQHGFRPDPGQWFFVLSATTFAFYYTLNTRAATQRQMQALDGQVLDGQVPDGRTLDGQAPDGQEPNGQKAHEQQSERSQHEDPLREHPPIPVLALTSIALLTVGTVTSTLSLIMEPWQATLETFTPGLAGWVLASALVATALRFFVQTWAQSLSNHSHGVVILILEPVWVALFAALWFGETMSLQQVAGCSLIFVALLVNRWGAVRKLLKAWL